MDRQLRTPVVGQTQRYRPDKNHEDDQQADLGQTSALRECRMQRHGSDRYVPVHSAVGVVGQRRRMVVPGHADGYGRQPVRDHQRPGTVGRDDHSVLFGSSKIILWQFYY